MGWFETVFAKWVVKQRWWIIVTTVLIVLTAASGGRFLTFENDSRVFFSKENPQLQVLEELEDMENTYTENNIIFFAIAPKDRNVFTRETLAAVQELTKASWQIPYSSRVDSITNLLLPKLSDL